MRTSNNQSALNDPQGGHSLKQKNIELPENSRITERLILDLDYFLDSVTPNRLSRNLRNLFLLYLSSCEKEDGLPSAFQESIIDFYFLFEFLDNAAEELENAEEIIDGKKVVE